MKLPRDLSGEDLVKALSRVGYRPTRQTGSHVRLTAGDEAHEHHLTVPLHASLRVGTLAAILSDVAAVRGVDRDALLQELFG